MIVQDAASAASIPTSPITVPHSVLSSSPVARPSEARSGTPRPAMTNTGTPSSLELSASTIRSASKRALRSRMRSRVCGFDSISRSP